jgi:hypothetical protein
MDFDNQSMNLAPVVRFFAAAKTPPASAGYLIVVFQKRRLDGKLALFEDGGMAAPAMANRGSL